MMGVEIRGLRVGEGMPKIIVPIVDASREAIVEKAKALAKLPIHMVEWRADHYDDYVSIECLTDTLIDLRRALNDMALLFTLRTTREGGKADVSDAEYARIIQTAVEADAVDAVDIQMLMDAETVDACVRCVHSRSVIVIGSNHEFHHTPEKAELVSRLKRMADSGADILKIAVMPKCAEDVLTLLSATSETHARYPEKPLITMSMSGIGSITRVCGEVFGSAMTFASVGTSSAPGQIPLDELIMAMDIIHRAL